MINCGGVFMLAGKASDTTLVGGAMNNLGGEDIHTWLRIAPFIAWDGRSTALQFR